MKTRVVTTIVDRTPELYIDEAIANGATFSSCVPVFFAVKPGCESYLLVNENGKNFSGYIFRSVASTGGHSGHHATKQEAIKHVLETKGWAVYRFDSLREAAENGVFAK
jgi:hypothetical protein